VSKKLIPLSSARLISGTASSSSSTHGRQRFDPNVRHPSAMRETFTPALPRLT
jgi:hypothetical protein